MQGKVQCKDRVWICEFKYTKKKMRIAWVKKIEQAKEILKIYKVFKVE